ncbi:MAG: carboxypeptidase-like regulatory domain-containing protein [Methanosarcinaceae archaeon]
MKNFTKIYYIFLIPFYFLGSNLQSQIQEKAGLQGTVIDWKTKEPIFGANVFLVNTTLGAAANQNGEYLIKNIPPGNYELMVSMMGYEAEVRTIRFLSSESFRIDFQLKMQVLSAPEITVRAPKAKDWQKNLKRFKQVFLGETKNASKCEMLNPEILDFEKKADPERLVASAGTPLKIINYALGLQAEVFLLKFISFKDNKFQCVIKPKFTNLRPKDEKQKRKWLQNQFQTYQGSRRHFLAALAASRVNEESFRITVKKYPVSKKYDLLKFYFYKDDWFGSIISNGSSPLSKYLHFKDFLVIDYCDEVSSIRLTRDMTEISMSGYALNAGGILNYGRWRTMRFAEALPFDYEPPQD